MLKHQFFQHSCYKLMFMMAVFDIGAINIGSIFCGSFSIRGEIFCTNPDLIYLVGCFQATFWCSACMTGLLLLINLLLDIINSDYANMLFGGKKTFVWMMFPLLFGGYICVFTTPFLFNSIMDASMMNPYMGIPEIKVDIQEYDNWFVALHNYFVACAYPTLYLVLCAAIIVKIKGSGASDTIVTHQQKQIIIQSIIISAVLATIAIAYMYMQYFTVPSWFFIAAHFMWQAAHGISVFTYIFVNRTMRSEAIQLIKNLKNMCKVPSTIDFSIVKQNRIQQANTI